MKEKLKVYANEDNYSDIETQGLWDSVHGLENVHCLCSIVVDPDTKEDVVLLFHDKPDFDNQKVWDDVDKKEYTLPVRSGTLIEGFRYWYTVGQSQKGKFFIHNCHGYDKPIVEKVLPKCEIPFEKWNDTFIQSKLQWFDRPAVKGAQGVHGLSPYGVRFGVKKPPITDWKEMTPYILHRIVEDCRIQKLTTEYLEKENDKLKELGVDLTEAMKMESRYVETCHEQEIFGAKVDIDHMNKCIDTWDKRCDILEKIIEPKLPPTVKVTGGKLGKKELATLLGYPEKSVNKIVEETQVVKRNGETIVDIVKPYYKPSVNFHITKKVNQYSGFNISGGFSPKFIKKTELNNWIKNNHPDTKPKEWDIEKEVIETKLLNKNTCEYFSVQPEDMDIIAGPHTKVKFVTSTLTQHDVVKAMLIKSGIKSVQEWNLKKDENGIVKATENITVHYPPKASYENQLHLDIKKGEALVTSPKIGEKDYKQLTDETGKMVGEYNTTMHRRRFISNPKNPENKGILSSVREDGRIPCGVNPSSTTTLRSSHRNWVNAAGGGSLYGEEIRKIIIAPEGRVLVSADQNSAQLSLAAYYANNYDYFKAVAEGNEFKVDEDGNEIMHPDTGKPWYIGESGHCVNARAFTLISEDEWKHAIKTQDQELIHDLGLRRKKSKGGSFSTIFGASGKKVAQTLDIPEELGTQKRNSFLSNIGLDRVMDICETMVDKYKRGRGGYIELPFGYYAYTSQKHKFFNVLDQGSEAACEKWAELYFDRESKRLGLDCARIMSIHDEFTVECAEDQAQDVGKIMNDALYEASIALWEWHKTKSKFFVGSDLPSFPINLSSGFKVGKNYWDVH